MLAVLEGAAHGKARRQRNVEHALDEERVIVAVIGAQHALERVDGLVGDDVDRAASGVAAEQGALRSAQDLDALHVEQVGRAAGRTGSIDAVDIDADRLVDGDQAVRRALAADEHGRRTGLRDGAGEREVRGGRLDLLDADDLLVGKCLAGDGADRDRRRLKVFVGLARADDDIGDAAGAFRLVSRLGESGKRKRKKREYGCPTEQVLFCHDVLPGTLVSLNDGHR